jgi:hypothetical protein
MWEGTINPGDTGNRVLAMTRELRRVGFPLPTSDVYDPALVRVVKAFQMDMRIDVDGLAGKQTRDALEATKSMNAPQPDRTARAGRLSSMLGYLWDDKRFRMIPGYRSSSIKQWQAMEAGERLDFVVPLACDGSEEHGATCGHAAWLIASWFFSAMLPQEGIYPTWRSGRGPAGSQFSDRWIPYLPVKGRELSGRVHRGIKEYVVYRHRVRDLCDIWDDKIGDGDLYYLQRDSGHVVLALVVRQDRGFIDPRTKLPARTGTYRFAADGSRYTLGQPWTFKRVCGPDKGQWTAWEFEALTDEGKAPYGPLADAPHWPLVLE